MPPRAASGYGAVWLRARCLRREYFAKSIAFRAGLGRGRCQAVRSVPISLRRSQPEKLSIAITISTIRIM